MVEDENFISLNLKSLRNISNLVLNKFESASKLYVTLMTILTTPPYK